MVRWSFVEGYTIWTFHGERDNASCGTSLNHGPGGNNYTTMMDNCGDVGEAVGDNNYISLDGVFEDMDSDADADFDDPKNVKFFEAMEHHLDERDHVLSGAWVA